MLKKLLNFFKKNSSLVSGNNNKVAGRDINSVGDNNLKSKVVINGRMYEGNNISISNGEVRVDGSKVDDIDDDIKCLKINGDINGNLTTDLAVNCNNVDGDISSHGSINCDDVFGSVYSKGSVNCEDVNGDITANGSVNTM
jgi:hypothetical protein